jgi:hypothetical protein
MGYNTAADVLIEAIVDCGVEVRYSGLLPHEAE